VAPDLRVTVARSRALPAMIDARHSKQAEGFTEPSA
jgi:hypothetical protein